MIDRTTVANSFPASRGKRRTFRGKYTTALIPPLTTLDQTYLPLVLVSPALQMPDPQRSRPLGSVRTD
jgi:hypothetical protein